MALTCKVTWAVPLDKLMVWKSNTWAKYEHKSNKLFLRAHYDQLLITSDSKILECFNMNNKIKGIYKEDILILIVSATGLEMRKIKFQIKNNVSECLQKLGEMFPVISHHKTGASKDCIQSKYRSIDEVLKLVLTQQDSNSIQMPQDFAKFVKLSLLDPNFAQILKETENILKDISHM